MVETNRDFVKVAEIGDIQPTNMKVVEVAGEKICVAKGTYHAVDNICTHKGDPLNEGTLEGYDLAWVQI